MVGRFMQKLKLDQKTGLNKGNEKRKDYNKIGELEKG